MSKKTEYACDICSFKTTDVSQLREAKLVVDSGHDTYIFDVCVTCIGSRTKSVFRIVFNNWLRKVFGK